MTALTWLAIGIGVPVAYAAMAGLAYRLMGGGRECLEYWKHDSLPWEKCGTVESNYAGEHTYRCANCDSNRWDRIGAAMWPLVGVWLFAHGFVFVLAAPLRATFRLTSGQSMHKRGEVER